MRWLLDVNLLVALTYPDHSSHLQASAWFHSQPDRPWATCPLTQGGFLRIASRRYGGTREQLQRAFSSLIHNCRSQRHEYWPADIDLCQLGDMLRGRLLGHNQIADLQLLLLAHRRHAQLATLDKGIVELARGTRYANSVTLI